MNNQKNIDFTPQIRKNIWKQVIDVIEDYFNNTRQIPVTPDSNVDEIRNLIEQFDLESGFDENLAIEFIVNGLKKHQLHTPNPNYFGLFNPATSFMSIIADTLVATFNPQLAVWSHSPFPVELEQYLIKNIGKKFGYNENYIDGTFTTGGTEANFTAVLTSLMFHFPNYIKDGLFGLKSQPIIYVSSESHHSIERSARLSGIGKKNVHIIPVDENLKMNISILQRQIVKDREDGFKPFLVVATAGTTNAGVIDPLQLISRIALKENLWFHVDAAWGGAAILLPELKHLLDGIEKADSITFDAHKWLSAPMGAGIFLTKHPEILNKTFAIQTDYMPKDTDGLPVINPYVHSVQWSRRFIGLKVYLPLLVTGWKEYIEIVRHQYEMGKLLKQKLLENGWKILNNTNLPVICFCHPLIDQDLVEKVLEIILKSKKAWISITKINEVKVFRACITNYRTDEQDIQNLVNLLNDKMKKFEI